ncbi:hypothetical protein [Fervidibacillus albus]|uniref:Multi-TM2 domain-containing protein n=1 Tax=Fervidibacillus albus TaxID=2980026 RepID=A0A9E8LSS0_9BACI|nr:hypothetical protein [Fervidibacillus albus]WAA08842.1 hypothetical protein OE104_09495 [Fervidibacillus albus]
MKNPILAFLLSFFPGGGLLYLGKLRGIFYLIGIFFIPVFFIISGYYGELFAFGVILAFLLYFISFVDTIASSSKMLKKQTKIDGEMSSKSYESERFYTIILSFIPGLGHFQLGLMNRGITFLLAFFGTGIMVFFVTLLLSMEEFLVFGLILPVIWFYSFFDVMNQLSKKQNGEALIDTSILEDLEESRESGKKIKVVAKVLSLIPGVGHLYLGYQKRGFQLLAIFFLSIYLLDFLRLGLFLFIIPILWFYAFFDGLQKASTYEGEEIVDEPIIQSFANHQKWIGVAFIFIGLYYLAKNTLFPILEPIVWDLYNISIYYWFDQYFQTAVVSLLFIIGGIKLLVGNKKHISDSEENNRME